MRRPRRFRAELRTEEGDDARQGCPHVLAARPYRLVDDVEKARVVHSMENVEYPVVRNVGLGAIGTRTVELDAHVASEWGGLLDTPEQLRLTHPRSRSTTRPGTPAKLPAVKDNCQVRVVHLLDEAQHVGAGAA